MKFFLSFLAVCFFLTASAQTENYQRHKVQKSETVNQIAQKYQVTPAAIYRLNPDAYKGIKENEILLVPTSSSLESKPASSGTHFVNQGETLFSIAKRYNVTVDGLVKANPVLANGLKSGQTIVIPGLSVNSSTTAPVAARTDNKPSHAQIHVVKPGETKFSIAKMYGISVGELERQNPAIRPSLPAGYELHIVSETKPAGTSDPVVEKPGAVGTTVAEIPSVATTETVRTTRKVGYANYEVKAGETLFSLSQNFGISQEELIGLNPTLKDGVKTGMILKVPGKGSITVASASGKPLVTPLSSYSNMERKKVVLLLPFNASRITADTANTTTARLKKDGFLNLTLDFYAGALVALDSAKALGMNFDVSVLDSEESKAGSSVLDLAKSGKFQKADVVVGPFYQQHAEKLAQAIPETAVVSPLSKESGQLLPNLFQAMPSEQLSKQIMLDYLASKNANVIVVNDPKRLSNRELISTQYPAFRFAEIEASGSLEAEKLKAMLRKDVHNYIVIDTERTGTILSATNALLTEVANFPMNLVIIEPNDTLEFEEISMKRLTVLKLIFPSMTRDNEDAGAIAFRNAYREKNKVLPSMYATRGFDVMFDTLMRLASGKSYADSVAGESSQQIESRFDYKKNEEGHVNEGIYILQYNDDLSVIPAE